jgi:spermidine/putrescine-binding protein
VVFFYCLIKEQMSKSRFSLMGATLLVLVILTGIPGCDGSVSSPGNSLAERGGDQPPAGKVRLAFHNWDEYIGSQTLDDFARETGIEVDIIAFTDDEVFLGALQSGLVAADLAVVSRSVAMEMIKARLLDTMDASTMPNLVHLDPSWLEQGIPEQVRYMVPYLSGTTGLMVNTRLIPEDHGTWKILWDDRYSGRLAMLDNPFEVAAAAAKMLGYPVNPEDPEQLAAVREALLRQKPLLAGYFDHATLVEMMVAEELWAAQIYSGDGMLAAERNEDILYLLPEEGGALWVDVFVLPRGSRYKAEAQRFIDYVHRPEVMASIASELWMATPNRAARALMDPEVLGSPAVHPPQEFLDRSESFGDMGSPESVRGRLAIWIELVSED